MIDVRMLTETIDALDEGAFAELVYYARDPLLSAALAQLLIQTAPPLGTVDREVADLIGPLMIARLIEAARAWRAPSKDVYAVSSVLVPVVIALQLRHKLMGEDMADSGGPEVYEALTEVWRHVAGRVHADDEEI